MTSFITKDKKSSENHCNEPKNVDRWARANNSDADQTAPEEAVLSQSDGFAILPA